MMIVEECQGEIGGETEIAPRQASARLPTELMTLASVPWWTLMRSSGTERTAEVAGASVSAYAETEDASAPRHHSFEVKL